MKQYLDIVERILDIGHLKSNRTGVDTLVVPFQTITHDMREGFPLISTKKMAYKSMLVELEGFIKGITSKGWFQKRGCQIWTAWANPKAVQKYIDYCVENNLLVPTRKQIQKQQDDLGPLGYSHGWRNFGAAWDEDDDGPVDGYDQLKYIVDTLKANPDCRRLVCSAWNPNQLDKMALPPCHVSWNVVHVNGVLNLGWYQRSCDFGLGVPFNIASYATLLLLLCKESGLKPGILHGTFADAHIYINHIDQLTEQCKRIPKKLPTATIPSDNWTNIFEWKYTDFVLKDYFYYPKLTMPVAI